MKRAITTLAIATATMLFATSAQATVILFQDNFDGSSADLNGTTPDITQGTTVWQADEAYNADGSIVDSEFSGTENNYNARLALGTVIDANRGSSGAIFTLDATMNITQSGAKATTFWQAIGFFRSDTGVNFANTGIGEAWMLRRVNDNIRAFRGPSTVGSLTMSSADPNNDPGQVDFRVVLDLSDWDGVTNFGSATFLAKLSSAGSYNTLAFSELNNDSDDFAYVGFGGGGVNGTLSFFQLTTEIPTPAALPAGLALMLTAAARRRR